MKNIWTEHWGGDFVVTRRRSFHVSDVDGFIAEQGQKKVGLITYEILQNEVEITSINSLSENKGIGTSLVSKVVKLAHTSLLKRVVLVTTNDNINALRFWQKRGFRLVRVSPGAMAETRKQKPCIPLLGENGIPIRDEIELEMVL